MQRKQYILPYTLIVIAIIFCLFFLAVKGWLGVFENSVQLSFFSVGALFHHTFTPQTELEKLKAENVRLSQELAQKQLLENDNKALRDQFNTQSIASTSLIPARIVGMPAAIPNVTLPEEVVIDKGSKAGIEKEMIVVLTNNGIGQIKDVSDYFAKILLTTSRQFALSGKDSATGALGVIKGMGNGGIVFDAVLLSDTLNVGDIVVSQGNQDMNGKGFAPNIVIGKITGVEKNPSALFQRAQVAPLFDMQKVSFVFVVKSL